MAIAARGSLATPVDVFRTMLSNCTSFQKLVQAASAAAALAKIYSVAERSDVVRPYALVDINAVNPEAIAGGNATQMAPRGMLNLVIEIPLVWSGTVTAQNNSTIFTASALAALADNFLAGLQLSMTSGAQQNNAAAIASQVGASGQITLASALPGAPVNGDQFKIRPLTSGDAAQFFLNSVGDILDELKVMNGTSGCLKFSAIRVTGWGRCPEDKQQTDYYGINFELDYGL